MIKRCYLVQISTDDGGARCYINAADHEEFLAEVSRVMAGAMETYKDHPPVFIRCVEYEHDVDVPGIGEPHAN